MPHKLRYIQRLLWAVVVTVTAVMAVSCGHRPTRAALDRADALIDEHEDSALAVLQAIDTTRLSGRRDHALYGLLMTQARVKLHLPVTSDSLIAPASRYFAASSDRHHAMRAYFYHGHVKYENGQYPAAMVLFFRARDLALADSNHFWAGLACRGISDTYHKSYNVAEALLYAQKAYAHFAESGRWLYIRYSKLDLATEYCSLKDYAQTTRLLEEVIDTAQMASDRTLEYYAKRLMGHNYYNSGNYKAALPYYKEISLMPEVEPGDSVYLALTELALGNIGRAIELYDTITDADSLLKEYLHCGILKTQGDSGKALVAREKYDALADSVFSSRANINLNSSLAEVMRDQNIAVQSDLQETKMRLWIVILLALLIIVVVISISLQKVKSHRANIEKNVNLAAQLQLMLSQKTEENIEATETIKFLLASRFTILEDICRSVIVIRDEVSQKRKVSQMMSALIKDLSRDSSKIAELGKDADRLYDGIYSDFCSDFPRIKDEDRRLFLFSVHNFSNTAIQFFLGEDKMSAVYDRRRHLKDRIKKLPQEKAKRYMSYFGDNIQEN